MRDQLARNAQAPRQLSLAADDIDDFLQFVHECGQGCGVLSACSGYAACAAW